MRHPLLALLLVAFAFACDAADARHKAAGNLHFKEGRYDEARQEYEKAVRARPDEAGGHILLGNAQFELGDYDGSKRSYEEALRLDAKAPEAHRGLAIVIMRTRTGDRAAFDEAREHLQKVIDVNPKDRNAIVSVAQLLSENADKNDVEGYARAQREAEELLRRVLPMDDSDPRTLFHLALVYARKGDVTTSLQVVDRLEKIVTDKPGFGDYTRAIVYTIVGDDAQALSWLERLVARKLDDPEVWRKDPWLAPLARQPRFAELLDKR